MPNPELKLAIFDLGRVVINIDTDQTFAHWSKLSGIEAAALRSNFSMDKAFEDFECGRIDGMEFHRAVCRRLSINLSYEDFVLGWNDIFLGHYEEVERHLASLKTKLKVVAFTNTNELHCEVWEKMFREPLSHFHEIFISSRIGMRKPYAEGFLHILDRYQVKPEETIFFDDHPPNIEAAGKLGINSILVEGPHSVTAAIKRFNLA